MINKVDTSQIHDLLPQQTTKKNKDAQAASTVGPDAAIQVVYSDLISEAISSPLADDKAVENAKALLASGQLDSQENIQKAAENIIDFGF